MQIDSSGHQTCLDFKNKYGAYFETTFHRIGDLTKEEIRKDIQACQTFEEYLSLELDEDDQERYQPLLALAQRISTELYDCLKAR